MAGAKRRTTTPPASDETVASAQMARAEQLAKVTVKVKIKAGENDRLFGSVTAADASKSDKSTSAKDGQNHKPNPILRVPRALKH